MVSFPDGVTADTIEWCVPRYQNLLAKKTDVYFSSYESLKEALHKPATTYVSHDVFVGSKKTNAEQYKAIKGKNGLIMSGMSPIVDGMFTCAKGSPKMTRFCLIACDYDNGMPSDFVERFQTALQDYTYIAHTTVSSTAEDKHWRIIVPLAHFVDAETKTAITRLLVDRIGWAGFDDASLRPAQRMALPVKLSDQEVEYVENTGAYVDESILPDGWDITTLPQSPKERENNHVGRTGNKKALTPMKLVKLDKGGVIGAFLKSYTCADILERSGLYEKTSETEAEQRWSRKGDKDGGLCVYPNDLCVCYYSSDILNGEHRVYNAFSLAVALLYDGDFKTAITMAKKDAKVRHELMQGLIDKKPADSGDWGDGEAYAGGWRGILERLGEYRKYRYMVVNEKKNTGYWLVFDGSRYKTIGKDEIGNDIEMVLRITCAMNPDLADIYNDYITNNKKCLSLVDSFSGLPNMKVPRAEWDADNWLLNCKDKVIDIKKYIDLKLNDGDLSECLLEHSADLLVTKITPISAVDVINPDTDAVEFLDRFLTEVMPDQEALEYMMTAVGSSLVDCSRDNKIIILQGEAGRNGKTSFLDCIKGALGDYYGSADAENFRMGAKDPSKANPQLDRLRDKRLATFSEVNHNIILDISYMKQFWGSDNSTRDLNESGGLWRAKFRGIFDLNSMPRLSDPGDKAFKARLRIIPWTVSFMGRENPKIQERLQDDLKVQAVMMAYLLRGCAAWAKNGYMLDRGKDVPPAVKMEIEDFYADIDDIGGYIEGYIEVTNSATDFVPVDDILADYAKSGGADIRKTTFSKQFKRRMLELAETNLNIKEGRAYMVDGTRPRGWFGIKLRRLTDDELVKKANENGGNYARWEANNLRGMVDKTRMEPVIKAVAVNQTITQAEIDAMAEKDELPF